MKVEPRVGFRGFFRGKAGRVVLLLLTIGLVFATFTYVAEGAFLAIPLFLIVGLGLPIWAGLKRPRYLALTGLAVLLIVAPLANVVITQEIRAPAPPSSAAATVPSASGPIALVVNNSTEMAYVADYAADNILAVNVSTGAVGGEVGVGALPFAVAFSPSGHQLYALDLGGREVSVVNLTTNKLAATVPVGTYPDAIGVDAVAGQAFVANFGSSNVSVLATSTDRVVTAVTVGGQPDAVAVDAANQQIYVANRGSGTVTAIFANNDSVAATIPVGADPSALALDPNGSDLVVADTGSGAVSLISTATDTVSGTVAVGAGPVAIAVGPTGTQAYVSVLNSSSVVVVSLPSGSVARTVHLGGQPDALAVDSSVDQLLVAEVENGTVATVSTSTWTVLANVSVGSEPTAIVSDPAAGIAVVAAYGAQSVELLRTADDAVLHTIADGLNGPLLQNASVTPFVGGTGTTFVFNMSLYPWFVPVGNAEILRVNLYLSTCPGATTTNDSACGSSYSFVPQSLTFTGPLTSVTNLSLAVRGLSDGIWSWTVTLVLSGLTIVPALQPAGNSTYLFIPANQPALGTEGPVVGSYAVTYGEVLPEIYVTDLVYLGIPFYFLLILYMWFKNREARHRDAIRRAAKAMSASAKGPQSGTAPPGSAAPGSAPPTTPSAASSERACPSCGAVVYPNEAKCWKCGASLGGGSDSPLPSKN
jgi:YVTN family beta-propeller protein